MVSITEVLCYMDRIVRATLSYMQQMCEARTSQIDYNMPLLLSPIPDTAITPIYQPFQRLRNGVNEDTRWSFRQVMLDSSEEKVCK